MKHGALATALASFLALANGCTGNVTDLPEVEGGGTTNSQTGGKGKSAVEPAKPKTILAFACKDVPLADCDKKFFGEQRCEKNGQTCVELQQPISFTTKRCDELSADACGKSILCQLNGNACEDREHVFEPPCKDKDKDPCLAKNDACLFDSVIHRCGKNPYGGRCVFDATKCALNGTGDNCANTYGGTCRKVEVAANAECRLNTNVCAILNSGKAGAATGPTGVVITTSDANSGGAKALQANGVISHSAARTSAAICQSDPANLKENDAAIPSAAAANACQDIFNKELADRLAANAKVAGSYETNLQSYSRMCTGLQIKGAKDHADGSVDEVRNSGGAYFYWDGKKYDLSADGNKDDVNASNWCQWVPKKTIQCEVDKTQLRNADPCKGQHTQKACTAKTECLWQAVP